ncbi:MAG TPA: PLP-dependent aspartate aminotransferase family protein [Bryobacteraceae bacterium]|nr:PLP-dependent aspartate aminotransferase family protein [Bryobacteraceae bacterium]
MNIYTKAVHAGDRKKQGDHIPVTTPIYTASSFVYESIETTDQVFGNEVEGYAYARYDNPTNHALEELCASLESGHGSLACSTGMAALELAITTALLDRRKKIVAANALYGATINLLAKVMEPFGIETTFVDICDLEKVAAAIAEEKPGAVLMETISNPLLRVGSIEKIAALCKEAGAALIVDNTFATPLLVRPLELGANLVVHSLTKYLAGHGDVMGGLIVSDEAHFDTLRTLSKTYGPTLGPFEAYLAMRGIKTFPLRMERQCQNAIAVAEFLRNHPRVAKVNYLNDPAHADAATLAALLPEGKFGAMISFEIKDAGRAEVFAFMNKLKLVVKATSLGDVHTMMLYPAMSSHRDLSPKQRERLGIRDSLVRLSVGIEDAADICADLNQAF